jgi:hypothetical protein
MLYQGKFKELAVNLGLGLVSSAISTIADRVMRGVQAALTKNGKFSLKNFTFKGFFGGAWSGLKRGLHDVFGRGWKSLIPVYGRYCAPSLGIGAGETAPGVDGIDNLCEAHDIDYNTSKDNAFRLDADKVLFKGLFSAISRVGIGDIVFGGRPSGGNAYRFQAITLFGGVIVFRTVRP